jgi:hypothetical protein
MSVDEALKLVGVVGVYPSAIGKEPVAGRSMTRARGSYLGLGTQSRAQSGNL